MSKLADLGQILNGAPVPKNKGKYPAFGGNGIISYVDKYNYKSNTVVIGRVGANCGDVSFSDKECWVTDNALALIVNEQNDPYFVYNLLKVLKLNTFHIGSSQPLITQRIINNIECNYIKDINHQKRIGSFFSNIDKKIQNNKKQIETLESIAKTIYDYWFVQFDFPNEDGKPYKSSGGKMVWNEELKREIPEGWNETCIEKITNCLDSKRIPLSGKQRELKKGNIPYYGATSIMGFIDEFIFDGDYVLMAEDGSIMTSQNTPILQRISGKTWVNNHAHVIEPIGKYSCSIIFHFLKNVYVPSLKTGSIQAKITQNKMNSIKVVNIPDALLEKYNETIEPLDKKIKISSKEISNLNKVKRYLLPLIMNGQVSLQ